jgi:formylmethanofuran dehydrogenase subunit C
MILRWLDRTGLPVDAGGLTPRALLGRPAAEVARTGVRVGNQDAELGDLFEVGPSWDTAATAGESLVFEGDLRNVRGLAHGMEWGRLVVRGVAGARVGAGMSGGIVEVEGDAGDGAGAEMRGGLLRITGNAGHGLGAAEPGSRLGMRDGVILVGGSAGDDAGRKMRRGLIAVAGSVGEGFGRDVIAGSLFSFGPVARYAGLGMKRGTIAVFEPSGLEVLTTFAASGRFRFPFVTIYLRRLSAWGFPVPAEVSAAGMDRYNGDLAEGGQGEILVRAVS